MTGEPEDPERGLSRPAGRWVNVGGDNFGAITIGDNSPIHLHAPLPDIGRVAPALGPIGVPQHVPVFVGREEELGELHARLASGPGVAVQALHGLGGIGKSALAARYIQLYAHAYRQVVWLDAQNEAQIEAGLAHFATALEPPLATMALKVQTERALQWLRAHSEWLLVLDNVERVDDIGPLLAQMHVADSGRRFLATSRRATGWERLRAAVIRLGPLEPGQALELLAAFAGLPNDEEAARALCEELGFLPLAIRQAGAYMAQNDVGPRGYLDLLARYPAHLYATGELDTDPESTIARIWGITLDRLTGVPLTGELLRILAWFASQDIPVSLLEPVAEQPALGVALGMLSAYSMITRTPASPARPGTGPLLAVHRLVQAVTRTPDLADPHRAPEAITAAREQAAALLLNTTKRADPYSPETWPTYRSVLPHIAAYADRTSPDEDTAEVSLLLNQAAVFLMSQDSAAQAISFLARVSDGYRRVLGDDSPSALTADANLAAAYLSAGDLERAIPLLWDSFADHYRVFGVGHPQTLNSISNLAAAQQSAGSVSPATITLLERAVVAAERTLGGDHPDTLLFRNNLASAYQRSGNLKQAIPLLERTLADAQGVLSNEFLKEHPHTLAFRKNLASAYQEAGDLARAIPLYESALAGYVSALGESHPDTMACRNHLASAYHQAGDQDRAIPLLERTLAGAVGPDEETVRGLALLQRAAQSLLDRGKAAQAVDVLTRVSEGFRRVLGDEHPKTIISRNNLAAAYRAAGDLGRAIPLLERNLADATRLFDEDRPETLHTRSGLGTAYQDAGDLGRAIPLLERAAADAARVLGEEHPLRMSINANLNQALARRGWPEDP